MTQSDQKCREVKTAVYLDFHGSSLVGGSSSVPLSRWRHGVESRWGCSLRLIPFGGRSYESLGLSYLQLGAPVATGRLTPLSPADERCSRSHSARRLSLTLLMDE